MPELTDRLKDRTTDFMHSLAASAAADAANISADPTGAGMMVHTWLHEPSVPAAENIAEQYGFELHGEVATDVNEQYNRAAAEEGRKRYRFETEEGY